MRLSDILVLPVEQCTLVLDERCEDSCSIYNLREEKSCCDEVIGLFE